MLIKPSQDTFYVIYDSIVKEYNLTPVDILVYSIIRSYCDSNDNKGYYGSIQSLAERINSSVPTVQRSLNRLVSGDKPLLERKQNKFNCSVYTTIKMIDDGYQNDRHKTIKMIDNNKIDNKINDIKENIKENLTEDGLDFSDIVIPKKNYCFRNGKKVQYSNKYDDADLDFLLE